MSTPSQQSDASGLRPRVLITAGPTHEAIDAIRFVGNRSSGRLGCALADDSTRRGFSTTLLLGPCCSSPTEPAARVERFVSCADLQTLLARHAPEADIIIMAAAVADFRPLPPPSGSLPSKIRRTAAGLTLQLEPTPDLLAGIAASKSAGQLFVGFALEPAEGLMDAARAKMLRKGVGMIVANPLETMEHSDINATLLRADGSSASPGAMSKTRFASWLIDAAAKAWQEARAIQTS
jgi:phosphopantothenoylcysteine decarboxylase / phosphopantothenate---cysteine ligase